MWVRVISGIAGIKASITACSTRSVNTTSSARRRNRATVVAKAPT